MTGRFSYAARRGYTVREFDIPFADLPGMTARQFVALHEREIRPQTRVLVFPHIDNIVGVRHPTRELTAAARGAGVEFVAVDIAQSLGMVPVDAAAEGADFYAASPHKWVQAPKGLGLLIVKRAVRDRLDPLWVKRARSAMPATAEVFEDYSTRNLPAVLALADAIRFQRGLEAAGGTARRLELARAFMARVDAAPALEWRSPRDAELVLVVKERGVPPLARLRAPGDGRQIAPHDHDVFLNSAASICHHRAEHRWKAGHNLAPVGMRIQVRDVFFNFAWHNGQSFHQYASRTFRRDVETYGRIEFEGFVLIAYRYTC